MNRLKSVFSQYMGQSRSVYVLFFGRMVTSMGALIWPMLTMILSRKMGYNSMEVGLVLIVIGVIFLPATWIGGKLADRFNRKLLILVFDTISVIFFIACAFLEPGNLMLVFFVIAGWFANMEGPIFEALIMDATKPSEREIAFSMTYLGKNLGMIIGTAVGGLLFERYLSLAFALDGITTIISTVFIFIFVVIIDTKDLEDEEKNIYEADVDINEATFTILKDRKSVMIQVLIFFFIGFVYDQYTFVLPLYMSELYGPQGATYFGLVASFNAVMVIFLTPVLTKITDRYSELPKVMIGVLLFSGSYLMIIGNPLFVMFFAFMFVFTVGEVLNMLGTSPFVSRRIPATHRGRVNSYVYIAFFLGIMTGKGLMGYIIEYMSFSTAFMVLAVFGGGTVLLTWYNYHVDRIRFPRLYESHLQAVEEID